LCMGPPTRQSKLANLNLFLNRKYSAKDLQRAADLLGTYIEADSEIAALFDLYTFGDMKAFFGQLETKGSLFAVLKKLRRAGFKQRLSIENGFNLLRAEDLEFLPESLRGKTLKQLEKNNKVS